MCEPTTATMLLATTIASTAIQYDQAKQQQKNAYQRQLRQNELAKKNALQRYASEQLKIRQQADLTREKGFEASKKARKARASFEATAGDAGLAISGSTQALLNDYYRTEGLYNASLARNLDINVSQFNRNMDAIQFGQEAQSTYVQPPNSALLFASSALNVANTYYSSQLALENNDLMTNKQKNQYIRSDLGSS